MNDFATNLDQARCAYKYYILKDRSIAWDPSSRRWVPVAGPRSETGSGDDGGLSPRALQRIARIQDAERRGLISHDAAEAEILQIIREES